MSVVSGNPESLSGCCLLSGIITDSSGSYSTFQPLLSYGTCDNTTQFHGYERTAALPLLEVSSLTTCNAVQNAFTVAKALVRSWMLVLPEAGWTGKSNPYPEYMSILVRTDLCPFYDRRGPM